MRRPLRRTTSILPRQIQTVDLKKLSELVGCSQETLLRGLHDPHAWEVQGAVVPSTDSVSFESVAKVQIQQVLLTAATRPTALDSFHTVPKCCIQLAGTPIIWHILTHLRRAGMTRIVVSVSYRSEFIMDTIKRHPEYEKMNITFLELGEENRDCHARSILAARDSFETGSAFLIHTADHIFDQEILTEMCSYDLNDAISCVLVEERIKSFGPLNLPPTAVRVQTDNVSKVMSIGRKITSFNGIDAGLFLSNTALFETLANLASKKTYFSLADAMAQLCEKKALEYISTRDRTWFSIETQEQLAYAQDRQGDNILSPWTVLLAQPSTGPALSSSAPASRNFMFGMPQEQDSTETFRIVTNDRIRHSDVFNGFVVGVGHVDSALGVIDEEMPLLPPVRLDPLMLSIPVPPQFHKKGTDEAFLIELPEDGEGNNCFFAVPEIPHEKEPMGFLRRLTLPTDVEGMTLETVGPDNHIHVVIERRVPFIGYVILIVALLAVSSLGPAMDLETETSPILKMFWRHSATTLLYTPFLIHSLYTCGFPVLTWTQGGKIVGSSIANVVFALTFTISLEMTSIGDAYIFNNSHSLIIVFGKMLWGIPIAHMERGGALLGMFGGMLCTLDTSSSGPDPVLGDLVALLGAMGGVVYILLAKQLRPCIDLVVFMFCLVSIGAFCVFLVLCVSGTEWSFSSHPNHGLYGWITPVPNRLPVELFLVIICNGLGATGYIAVMKYFDPLVVSVVMLMEPIIGAGLGLAAGISGLPGPWTIFGGSFVLLGTYFVIRSASHKTQAINVQEALRPRGSGTGYGAC